MPKYTRFCFVQNYEYFKCEALHSVIEMRLLPVTLLSLFLLPSRILCLPRKGANLISTLEILGDLRVKLADLVGNIPSHNFTENPDDQQRPLRF